MKIAIVCGGPSLERGISLNSARSLLDHLESKEFEIIPIYLDHKKNAYHISKAQLYSNTPSDFDFKLQQTSKPLTELAFVKLLKSADLVFPVMHGAFGEDGTFQAFLEEHDIPFIGASSKVCKTVFDKHISNELINSMGFFTLPSTVLKIYHTDHRKIIQDFFKKHHLKRAIIKPAKGGSSIGVFSVSTPAEALEKAKLIFSKRMDTRVVLEPFAEGVEFTVIILVNRFGLPVAILPTEIETDYSAHQIFDFRKKYLPSRQVTYHCPPRFSNEIIEKIQVQAEQLFAGLGMRDFSRFDGWVFPDGNIWFSDINPISGMEQNSFLFQQAARVGLTHSDILQEIVHRACDRYNIPFPSLKQETKTDRKTINVIFGNNTSERQVSVMSGTNAWLKLRGSKKYFPQPFLLAPDGFVWQVPYHLALNHTAEEILETCQNASAGKGRLALLEQKVRMRLSLEDKNISHEFDAPKKISLQEFIHSSPFVFLGLHGGIGENGTLQKQLAQYHVKFNGSNANTSELCIDKGKTAKKINQLNISGVNSIPQKVMSLKEILIKATSTVWNTLCQELETKTIVAKPCSDGCSSGVIHLYSEDEFKKYINLVEKEAKFIPPYTFKNQSSRIEMPPETMQEILFEKFIETDTIRIKGNQLKYHPKTGWLETTIGVLAQKGKMKSLNPSITVAEGEVLSVEEKFQGGTGINITPPPESIIKSSTLKQIKERITTLANKIGLTGYGRIDAFMHVDTGDLMIIEVNTLPALTPSTVLYQQALTENPPIYPRELLEKIIANAGSK